MHCTQAGIVFVRVSDVLEDVGDVFFDLYLIESARTCMPVSRQRELLFI